MTDFEKLKFFLVHLDKFFHFSAKEKMFFNPTISIGGCYSYCSDKVDYVEHFFFECNEVKVLWKHLEGIILVRYGQIITLNASQVQVGWFKEGHSKDMQNFINHAILIGKMCISKYRYGIPTLITAMLDREIALRNLH